MIQFILEKLVEYYPVVGTYLFGTIFIVYVTIKVYAYYYKINNIVVDFPEVKSSASEIPSIKILLERIDRGLAALNQALLEKGVVNQIYHSYNNPK